MKNYFEDKEWFEIIKPIVEHPEFQKRKTFKHHGETTVFEHSIRVSHKAYKIAKGLNTDYRSAAIAGILHDFYTTPWQDVIIKQPIYKMHAFTHAKSALENSRKYFSEFLDEKIENAILRHMFPLNIIPPKHLVGYIVTTADKLSSLDMILSPSSIKKTCLAPIINKKD